MVKAQLVAKAREVYAALQEKHPDARCELNYSSPFELLVATVLSAQCTDARVNQVTADLFAKYRRPRDYLAVTAEQLEDDVRTTGFFRQKAKSIRGIMAALLETHGGQVPGTLDELTRLPGVGRKTANVILGNAFGVPGITVDTHVERVSQRLGLSRQKLADKIEQDLMKLFPESDWVQLSHTLIFHGRYICKARKPACEQCPVTSLCAYFAKSR